MTEWLSFYFRRQEFACPCELCSDMPVVDAELISVLEEMRRHFGAPVTITSGYRCKAHNSRVGGSPRSMHLEHCAADVVVTGRTPDEVHAYLVDKYPGDYGIGRYRSHTHLDTRPTKARWDYA